MPDRVLLVAMCCRTNLTIRQIGPLFGVSHSAAHRVVDTLGPLLALAPVRRRPQDQVAIVDGTLIPTPDHRLGAQTKNYRLPAAGVSGRRRGSICRTSRRFVAEPMMSGEKSAGYGRTPYPADLVVRS